jgi:uncharacterized protein (DUF983 family)
MVRWAGLMAALAAVLKGQCPQCGAMTLFDGLIKFAQRCRACGLDFTQFNVGDGPAAFLTLIVGGIVVIGAVALQLGITPPFWVHILIWPVVTLALVLSGLRIAKAWLLQSEYRNAAREGRIAK